MKAEDVARILLEAGRRTFPEDAVDVDAIGVLAVLESLTEKERVLFLEFANLVEKEARAPLETELGALRTAVTSFKKAWNEEDSAAMVAAFNALPPEGGAS